MEYKQLYLFYSNENNLFLWKRHDMDQPEQRLFRSYTFVALGQDVCQPCSNRAHTVINLERLFCDATLFILSKDSKRNVSTRRASKNSLYIEHENHFLTDALARNVTHLSPIYKS